MPHVALSRTDDWELKYDTQDIRGWPVRDTANNTIGTVDRMIIDTDAREVDIVVLDDGTEIPVRDLTIGEDAVYLQGLPAEATPSTTRATPTVEGDADVFRQHYDTALASSGHPYAYYEPAYRFGYEMAGDPRFKDQDFATAEPELQRIYESRHRDTPFHSVRTAMRRAFGHRTSSRRTL